MELFPVYLGTLIVGGGLVGASLFADADHDMDADMDVDVDADFDADHDADLASVDAADALWLPFLSIRFWLSARNLSLRSWSSSFHLSSSLLIRSRPSLAHSGRKSSQFQRVSVSVLAMVSSFHSLDVASGSRVGRASAQPGRLGVAGPIQPGRENRLHTDLLHRVILRAPEP